MTPTLTPSLPGSPRHLAIANAKQLQMDTQQTAQSSVRFDTYKRALDDIESPAGLEDTVSTNPQQLILNN